MDMFVIKDGILDEESRVKVVEHEYSDLNWFKKGDNPVHEQILEKVGKFFDLSEMVGYEMWCNATNPGWHYDKDEDLFNKNGSLSYPICSIVYYAYINAEGGDFGSEDLRLAPRTNRLLCFSPGVLHHVYPFQGKRVAIAINPWAKVPMSYEAKPH